MTNDDHKKSSLEEIKEKPNEETENAEFYSPVYQNTEWKLSQFHLLTIPYLQIGNNDSGS